MSASGQIFYAITRIPQSHRGLSKDVSIYREKSMIFGLLSRQNCMLNTDVTKPVSMFQLLLTCAVEHGVKAELTLSAYACIFNVRTAHESKTSEKYHLSGHFNLFTLTSAIRSYTRNRRKYESSPPKEPNCRLQFSKIESMSKRIRSMPKRNIVA